MASINKCKIKNLMKANHKDKEPPSKKSGIYKINSKQCEKVFIEQTKRNLETRTKEHFSLNHTDKSAIASHFWKTGHGINNSANFKYPIKNNYTNSI